MGPATAMSSATKSDLGIARSPVAKATTNPIRNIVDRLQVPVNEAIQPTLALNLGDPTYYNNLPPHPIQLDAVIAAVNADVSLKDVPEAFGTSPHGYPPAIGTLEARNAVARHASKHANQVIVYEASDVTICSGCSGALDMAITVLAAQLPGANVSSLPVFLVPKPGFTLYKTLCDSKGIPVVEYPLDPLNNWQVDLLQLKTIVDALSNIAGIIVNNPSNPCGSVYSKQHLEEIKAFAAHHHIPIIADEVYEDMVFAPNQYHPMAAIHPTNAAVITCSGTAKRFLAPGWRVGWILLPPPSICTSLAQIRSGLADLACLLLGANSIMQAALPNMLDNVPSSFHTQVNEYIAANAEILYQELQQPSADQSQDLHLVMNRPQGAIYALIGLDCSKFDFEDDVAASQLLISEESLKVLPGSIFGIPNYIRVVLSAPPAVIRDAVQRIKRFCLRHTLSQ